MSNENEFLVFKGINKSFSTVKVLKDISFSMKKGEILGLVGENGAGKSTLMNILGGILKSDAGEIYIDNKKYEPLNPLDAQKNGVAFIHQELNLFSNLTVAENFFIEGLPKNKILRTVNYKLMRKVAKESIKKLGEDINPNLIIGDLSIGKRQMVEIAKALTKQARIIIFDEPTTSLSNKEKEKLFELIRELSKKDVSIIYISHMLDDIFNLCGSIVVLRDGAVTGQDMTSNLTKEKVINLMVGREMCNLYPYVQKTTGKIILKVENLTQGSIFKNINLEIKEGEVVGLFGLMGAGRSDLVNAIFGVTKFDSGSVSIMDEKFSKTSPTLCISKGISYITENRREEGLLMTKPVSDNLVLAYLKHLGGKLNKYNRKKEDEVTDKAIKEVRIKTHDKNKQAVINLSGGNQQKVVIGKWILMTPKIFILDEPTKGIDVGAKYEIYNYINEIALRKGAVLVVSSEMEELIGICDRILVMSKGEITGELQRNEYAMEKMLKCAIGGEYNEFNQ